MKIKLMILLVILLVITGCAAGEPKKVSAETPAFLEEIGKQQTFYGVITKYQDNNNGCIVYMVLSQGHIGMTAVKP